MADLFEIGKSGVQAYRRALGVTGQNIANANTEGYNRRDAQLTEVSATQGDILSVSDQAGLGVRIENIRRAFDSLIVTKANTANSSFENARAANEKLSALERLVLPGDYSISAYLQNFFDGLNAIHQSPTDLGARQLVIEYGQLLADGISNLAISLQDLKADLRSEAEVVALSANGIVDGILEIQKKLISSGGSGAASNALLDQRDQLINDLSGLIGVTVDYQDRGAVQISLGQNFGKEDLINLFSTQQIVVDETSASLRFSLVKGSQSQSTSQVTNGYLSGLIKASFAIDETLENLSFLASAMVSDFNSLHSNGVTLDGNIGGIMFAIPQFQITTEKNNIAEFTAEHVSGTLSQTYTLVYRSEDQTFYDTETKQIFGFEAGKFNVENAQFTIDGTPADGDIVYIGPAVNAASNIKFLIERPEDIAAGSSFSISKDLNNEGTAILSVVDQFNETKANLPNIEDVFSNDLNIATARSFRSNLYSAIINPDVSEIEFSTSAIQSTVRFVISSGDFGGLKSSPIIFNNEAGETIKFILNSGNVEIQDLEELANRLNDGSLLGTIDDDTKTTLWDLGLVASTNGSALSFTQRDSAPKKIVDAQILGEPSLKFSNVPVSSGEVYVFTRDGRQISGPALSIDKASEFITVQNGFLDEAEYRADYLESGYLSVDKQQNSVSNNFYFKLPTSGVENKFFSTASTTNSLNSNGFDLWIGDQATDKVEQVISIDPGLIAVDINHEISQNLSKYGFNTKLSNLNKLSIPESPTKLSFSIRNTDGTYSDINVNLLSDDASPLVAQINLASGKTGILAEISNDKQSIILKQLDGADIVLADIQSSSAAQGSVAIVLQKLSSDGNLIAVDGAKKNLVNGASIRVAGELEISSSRTFLYGVSNYASQNSPNLLAAVEGVQTGFTNVTQTFSGDQKSIEFNLQSDLLDTSIDYFSAKSAVADTVLDVQIDNFNTTIDLSSLPNTSGMIVSNSIVEAFRNNASAKLVAELIFDAPVAGEIDYFDIEFEGQKYSGKISFPDTQSNQLLENADITLDGPDTGRFSVALKSDINGSYTLNLGAIGGVPTAETITVSDTSALNTSQVMTFSASNDDAEALSEASIEIFGVNGIYQDGKFIITTDTTTSLRLSPELLEGSEINISSVRATVSNGSLSLYDLTGNNINADFSVVSNVKNHIKLSNLPDEELIVIFDGANTSNFSTRFTSATNNINLPQNLSVRVMDGNLGIYEVFDAMTQQSLATRVANDIGEFSALGYTFKIDGSVRDNDSFNLIQISDAQANSDNILRMLKLNKFDLNTGQGEFNQIFKEMISDIGMRVKSSEITKQATEAAQQAILELKDEFSGVNLDTEAANLMEQQQAYQALARVLSTARDLLNTLMEVI